MPSSEFHRQIPYDFFLKNFEKLALTQHLNGLLITLLCYLLAKTYPANSDFDTYLPFKGLKSNQIKILRIFKT